MAPVRTKRIALVSTRIPDFPWRKKKEGGTGSGPGMAGPSVQDIVFTGDLSVLEGTPEDVVLGQFESVPPGADLTLEENAGGRFKMVDQGELATGAVPTDFEAAPTHIIQVRAQQGASSMDKAFSISVIDKVELEDFELSANTVAENASPGATVGVLTSTPAGAAYVMVSDAGGRFAINGSSLVRGATALDYESATTHTVRIRAALGGETLEKDFVIEVTDVAELTAINLSNNTINENSPSGVLVGQLSSTPAGASFTLLDNAGNRFALTGGTQLVAGTVATDYETATSHDVTVRGTRQGETRTETFSINVINVNELTGITLTGQTIAENSAAGTAVGVLASTPTGATFTLTDNAGGRFALSGNQVVAGATPTDYETATSHEIKVKGTLGADELEQTFVITVTDVDESLDINLSGATVAENTLPGVVVGDLSSIPSGATFTLDDTAGNRFALNGSNQIVTGSVPTDFEAATSHKITVSAERGGVNVSQDFTIAVTNVTEITNITLTPSTIAEDAIQGALVGTLASTPAGATWTLVNNAGNRFALSGGTIVRGTTGLDYEAAQSHDIVVRGTRGGETLERTLTITVTNVNEITDITLSNNTIAEDAVQGAVVGALASVPAGATLSLTNTAGNRFAISGGNLVRGATALDYETASSHQVTVKADLGADTYSKTFTVNVTDVSEEVEVSRPAQSEIMVTQEYITSGAAEGALLGVLVAIPKTSAEYSAFVSGVTYTLIDDAGGRFKLATGSSYSRQLLAGPTATDIGTASEHTITVRAEWDGNVRNQTIVMTVKPAGAMKGGTNQVLAAGNANPTAGAQASSGTAPYTYEWTMEESSGFAISSGQTDVNVTLAYNGGTPGFGWAVTRAVARDSAGQHAWSRFLALYSAT